MKPKNDIKQIVTDRIIEFLEKGVCPWRRPWSQGNTLPMNYTNKRAYSGVNWFLLNLLSYEQAYFMTYKQAKALGGCVRKGEKGYPVTYWNFCDVKDKATEEVRNVPFLRYYTVFNVSQIDGLELDGLNDIKTFDFVPVERAQTIVDNWQDKPAIEHDSGSAYYCPATDKVHMPKQVRFEVSEQYYSVLFHELAHSTGAEKRLNRKIDGVFGSNTYGKEELIAEMTSAMLCAECRIDNETIDNSASYLQSWIDTLRGDKSLVIQSASAAQKAANMIMNKQTEMKEEKAA